MKSIFAQIAVLILFIHCFSIPQIFAQSVNVGNGSYNLLLPSGAVTVSGADNRPVSPKVSSDFSQPVQSNDFWSSLIYPFFGVPHSNVLYAHPLNVKAIDRGLEIGYTQNEVFAANDYLYPFRKQLTVQVNGLNASQTLTDSYGDWTVTALWADSDQQMKATLGHGLPFVFFEIAGGKAQIESASNPSVWYQQDEVVGITVDGVHYGLFAPSGSVWEKSGSQLSSSLNQNGFFSIALLPNNSPQTLATFRARAYAFVRDSRVSWQYDESSSMVTSTYSYETELMDTSAGNLNETVSALYRHQWLNTPTALTDFTYESPRGIMKLATGNSFETTISFGGVIPALPDRGDYNPDQLEEFIKLAARDRLTVQDTYNNGKAMARFANLVHIADQIGAQAERDYFITQLKTRLEDWLTAGGQQQYVYNEEWDVLTGYPSSFGADNQINDHHFHTAYAIVSAATIAQYDPAWAALDQWGGMINMLIRDANNWNHNDELFPFLRSFDAYAGHSWAAGHGDFGDGNNQESSSESMNFNSAMILWGEVTNQPEIRDAGIYLYSTEAAAVNQYWFDVDNQVFPEDYGHVALGMVWGGKGVHSTWFGADPEFIHGINILPVTSTSLYLGSHPDYVIENYDEIVAERNSQPIIWKDVLWQYLALSDPDRALSYYLQDPNYERFDGESRAHTLHWLYNMKKMGHPHFEVTADIPTYAVFMDDANQKTYIAYNASGSVRKVRFSDGYEMNVPAGKMHTETTAEQNPNAPVAILTMDKTRGKTPLTVQFEASNSFDRQGRDIEFLWTFEDGIQSTAADTSYTFTDLGSQWVYLQISNDAGFITKDSVEIEVLGNGTPFLGNAQTVPARIEAEHYDKGGQGIAYKDVDANNIGLAFRPDEGVDLEGANDGGFDVYWIVAGEWIEYTFNVDEAGNYDFIPYVATVPGFGNFKLLIDNENISGVREVRNTGGWQFWKPIPIENVYLEAGTHIMRYEFDSATDKTGWLMSLNYTLVRKSVSTDVASDELLPQQITLEQNYPNPFNPSTQISFELQQTQHIRLEVFNMLGQSVEVLLDQRQTAGRHSITFDASNFNSGVYFYRITSSNFSQTRKMLLLR